MVLRERTHNVVVLCSKDNFLDLFVEVPDAEEIEVTEQNFEKAFAWDEGSVPCRNFASNASKRTTPEKRFSLITLLFAEHWVKRTFCSKTEEATSSSARTERWSTRCNKTGTKRSRHAHEPLGTKP